MLAVNHNFHPRQIEFAFTGLGLCQHLVELKIADPEIFQVEAFALAALTRLFAAIFIVVVSFGLV
jgi:hypothetical protein